MEFHVPPGTGEFGSGSGLHDMLTGLPTRDAFLTLLEQADGERDIEQGYAVLAIDVDQLRLINESMGQGAGDQALLAISLEITASVTPRDAVGRLSGDEFAVLLQGCPDAAFAEAVAARLQHLIRRPRTIEKTDIVLTASIGISYVSPNVKFAPMEAFRNAETALYRAKRKGRGERFLFDDQQSISFQRPQREAELLRAIQGNEFVLHYQPIVSLDNDRVAGFESLVRWYKEGRPVSPAAFIPLAEESGAILILGRKLIDQAIANLAKWRDAGANLGQVYVTINVSAVQFERDNVAATVGHALKTYQIPPACVAVELTETAFLAESSMVTKNFTDLQALGVRMLLDDFGTGYSSLSYLARFPVDGLKIDRSFVQALGETGVVGPILVMVQGLARSLGIPVVAEGIETIAERDRLKGLGAEYGQGYLWAKPLPSDEALAFYKEHSTPGSLSRIRPAE